MVKPPRSAQVIAYRRVSTEEQADSGLGLDAQTTRLESEATHRGWTDVLWLADEGIGAKTLDRPRLQEALSLLRAGKASILVVSKLDRLSRSIVDFARLLDTAERQGWAIIALDIDVDMTRATGRMVAKLVALIAEWERETIGERTSDALQVKKRAGARLGRPRATPAELVARVVQLRGQGMTLQAIADQLTAEQVPTTRGGRWWPATVRAVLASHDLDQEAARLSA